MTYDLKVPQTQRETPAVKRPPYLTWTAI